MSDDPFVELRRELLDAHDRQAQRRRRPSGRRGRWRLPSTGAIATAAAVLLSLVVGVGFVVLLSGARRDRSVRQPPDVRAVVGLFRRPQTAADRNARVLAQMRTTGFPGQLPRVRADTLRLGVARPFGRVYFALATPAPADPRARDGDQLMSVMTTADGSPMGGARGGSAEQIAQGGAGSGSSGTGRSSLSGWLLPDGVARIRMHFPRQRSRYDQVFPKPLIVDLQVSDNTALAEVPRGASEGLPDWIDWYDAHGSRIRRVTFYHAPAKPIPRPREEAASREARLHPSAPNRVTVTPTSGGPRTTFTVAFRNLVTGTLGLGYHVDGPSGPACTNHSIYPPDTLAGFAVRGTVQRYPIGPVPGSARTDWCRGSYRISVAVVGKNGANPPFGFATFTVR